ncbi:MAG: hypothetical protein BGO01_02950 [Armatimonadetes bacterium 55-13]|nr:MAG: hypothetical protein BGO01_02950 [Armatimonadetes bacterium 55-13]
MPNRLANESSPYLLQHQNNPVDWFPWGDEAFAKARDLGRPIFLSIGYSSCHWCHVMEHESFEDEDVAAMLNQHFVSVKVDREERPDIDETYMTAVQIGSGRGGWPMTVFLTPDRKPFFTGTYFPKEDRGEFPGFKTVLSQIIKVWGSEQERLVQVSEQFATAIQQTLTHPAPDSDIELNDELIDEAVQTLVGEFDSENGGFGDAPKFPPHTAIEFLLNFALRESSSEELRQVAADMALGTLEKMALGGFHDQVGGGFHRYSTDDRWLLPHFEKMLYDNALLLANYARAAAMCHGQVPELEALYSRVAERIVSWLTEEMTSDDGLFYSAIDADSEGEEGRFYVWTDLEIREVLGERADAFIDAFQVRQEGNIHEEATGHLSGSNILHALEDYGVAFDLDLKHLKAKREHRVRPGLDDKAIIGWNGLMIGALAEAGEVALAERAATVILNHTQSHGQLPRQIAKGIASGEGFLEDYAYFIDGLVSLATTKALFEELHPGEVHGTTSNEWLQIALQLTQVMIEKFYDHAVGGFFGTSEDHEMLFGRSKPVFDQPIPSANATALKCLVTFGDDDRIRQSLSAFLGWMGRAPSGTMSLFLVAMALLDESGHSHEDSHEVDLSSVVATTPPQAPEVIVETLTRELRSDGKGTVRISIPEGFHINSSTPPARWLIPTKIEVQPIKVVVDYPPANNDRYEGILEIPFTVELPPGQSGAEFELKVSYQACTETECLAPVEKAFDMVIRRS